MIGGDKGRMVGAQKDEARAICSHTTRETKNGVRDMRAREGRAAWRHACSHTTRETKNEGALRV